MSKVRTALVLAAGLGLAAAAQATAAPSEFKITGGGQVVVVDEDAPTKGAFDTLAYTAQGSTVAKGQVQFVGRGASNNGDTKFHGIVTSLRGVQTTEDGGQGEICGHDRDTKAPFTIFVQDMGEGKDAGDTATLTLGDDVVCDGSFDGTDEDGEDTPMAAVARGNAQVHKQKPTTTQGGKRA